MQLLRFAMVSLILVVPPAGITLLITRLYKLPTLAALLVFAILFLLWADLRPLREEE